MRMIGRCRHVLPALLVTSAFVLSAPDANAGLFSKLKKKLDKANSKVDKATEKATRPVDEANAKVDGVVGQATAPVSDAQRKMDEATNKATAPISEAHRKMDDAQNQAMRPAVEAQRQIEDTKARAMAPVRQVQGSANQIRQTPQTLRATAQGHVQNAKAQALRPVTMTQQRVGAMRSQLMSAERLTDTSFVRDSALSRFKLDALPSVDGKTLRLTGTVATAAQKLRAQQLARRNFQTVLNEIRVVPGTKTSANRMIVKSMSLKRAVKSNKAR